MKAEFLDQILTAQSSPLKRPKVQANTRAIQESTKPERRTMSHGGLAYPLPGKGVSGETTN